MANGNLDSKTRVGNYTHGVAQAADYLDGALVKANAVVQADSNHIFYHCDQNDNLRRRKVGSTTTTYSYDAENRLVTVSGAATASFVYDGDGNRVKATFGATSTAYVGNHYEKETTGATVRYRKYYYADGVRVATPALAPATPGCCAKHSAGARVRDGTTPLLILTDHLGSTAVMADLTTGARTGEVWYRPWGEYRGTPFGSTPTASHGALQDSGKTLQSGCTFTTRDTSIRSWDVSLKRTPSSPSRGIRSR